MTSFNKMCKANFLLGFERDQKASPPSCHNDKFLLWQCIIDMLDILMFPLSIIDVRKNLRLHVITLSFSKVIN